MKHTTLNCLIFLNTFGIDPVISSNKLVIKDTEVFLVLEGEVQFDKERMIDLQKYFPLSLHIRNLLLPHNMMFTEYLH